MTMRFHKARHYCFARQIYNNPIKRSAVKILSISYFGNNPVFLHEQSIDGCIFEHR